MLKQLVIVVVLFTSFFVSPAWSGFRQHQIVLTGALKNPKEILLTVEKIKNDFPSLINIETEWRIDKRTKFEGVRLGEFVKKYGRETVKSIRVGAINDYSQVLTPKDWNDWGALLAFQINGKVIDTKDKGTFRIVYDFQKYSNNPEVKDIIEANAVWQINRIEFIE